jgi:hypothetical protein
VITGFGPRGELPSPSLSLPLPLPFFPRAASLHAPLRGAPRDPHAPPAPRGPRAARLGASRAPRRRPRAALRRAPRGPLRAPPGGGPWQPLARAPAWPGGSPHASVLDGPTPRQPLRVPLCGLACPRRAQRVPVRAAPARAAIELWFN